MERDIIIGKSLKTRKNKRYNNKGPRYWEKLSLVKKKLKYFFLKESKRKHGRKFNNGQ